MMLDELYHTIEHVFRLLIQTERVIIYIYIYDILILIPT